MLISNKEVFNTLKQRVKGLKLNVFKSNKKKGFTLMEVLFSIQLFGTLFMIALTMQLSVIKVERETKQINNYSLFMEQIKNTMIYNSTYDEIQNLNLQNRYYISEEFISVDKIRDKNIVNLFVETKPSKEPYLVVNIEDGKVLKINLKLHAKAINNFKIMECEFYKGKYKKYKF